MEKTEQPLDTSQILDTDLPALLNIRIYPDPMLNQKCEPVIEITREIRTLIQNMFITMYEKNGVGLSANQVGSKYRIFVMDTSQSGDRRRAFINPIIVEGFGEQKWKEGCLSFPGIFATVKRYESIKVEAMNESGGKVELRLEGLDAICFQHETCHLDGITFYDLLGPVQKNLIKKKIANLKK